MLNINDKIAMFHARALKDYCKGHRDCEQCPFFGDVYQIGCVFYDVPETWDDKMISKEREE